MRIFVFAILGIMFFGIFCCSEELRIEPNKLYYCELNYFNYTKEFTINITKVGTLLVWFEILEENRDKITSRKRANLIVTIFKDEEKLRSFYLYITLNPMLKPHPFDVFYRINTKGKYRIRFSLFVEGEKPNFISTVVPLTFRFFIGYSKSSCSREDVPLENANEGWGLFLPQPRSTIVLYSGGKLFELTIQEVTWMYWNTEYIQIPQFRNKRFLSFKIFSNLLEKPYLVAIEDVILNNTGNKISVSCSRCKFVIWTIGELKK